jgi:sugar lactone lactonase YvrE
MRRVFVLLITLTLIGLWTFLPDQGVNNSVKAQEEADPPRLDRIRPERIAAGSPTFTVLLEGRRFDEGARVLLDGVPLDSSRISRNGRSLLAEVDASVVAAPGTHTVQGINSDNQTTVTKTFEVEEPDPELTMLLEGNAAEEDQNFPLQFPIRGEGFRSNSRVLVWGRNSANSSFVSETRMIGVISQAFLEAPARVPVMVETRGRLSNVDIFFVVPRPANAVSVVPDTIDVGDEDFEIEVNGGNFKIGAVIVVNGVELVTTVNRQGDLEATVPASFRAQPGQLTVRVEQEGIQSRNLTITVSPTDDPFIFRIAPALIRQNEEREVIEIFGANFGDDVKVLLDGQEVNVRNATRRRLTVVVREDFTSNISNHTLQIQDEEGRISNIGSFAVVPDVQVSTLVGTGRDGFNFDVNCVSREEARLRRPRRIAIGPDGLLYITDQQNHAIRSIDPDTGQTCTIAGTGVSGYNDSGNVRNFPVTFSFPNGLAFDSNGNILVTENGNNVIRRIVRNGAQVTVNTFAGRFEEVSGRDRQDRLNSTRVGRVAFRDGAAIGAGFRLPDDIIVAPDGTIYVADAENHAIRRIRQVNGLFVVDTLAGNGVPGFVDGIAENARFRTPTAIALSLDGSFLFVADTNNNRIRKVDIQTGQVTTAAGSGDGGSFDGPAAEATFFQPIGLAVDSDGTLYISEVTGTRIRRLDPAGNVTLVAGDNRVRFRDGPGILARFNSPRGLAIDRARRILYVADTEHFRIRTITLP